MRNFILALLVFVFVGCASAKVTPVKGIYQTLPFIATSSSNFNAVWDKLIDLFAQKGLPIKIIDRSSGLIISDRSVLPVTFELKEGGLKDPNAFIVLPKMYDPNSRKTTTIAGINPVTGEWNVRIKEVDGKTSINVNIVNVKYESWDMYTKRTRDNYVTTHHSTGMFESLISQAIQ